MNQKTFKQRDFSATFSRRTVYVPYYRGGKGVRG